ncbi:jhy protein homolog isoform X2 [Notolabrus celidotus]|uniref:jhy protein homolog isoform X2 n=1 Tax=Notolabrus celidotus TaxID=1203425 RepID=UPI00148FE4CA|nr:jhy protein homolog isoform X2 [Notolabrus celidotus]
MDKGLNKGTKVSKTEQENPPSARPADLDDQWESVESDTESLVQERAYQQQLQMNLRRREQNKYTLPQRDDDYSYLSGEDEDTTDDDIEYLHVYDSLEEAAYLHAKRGPVLPQSTQSEKKDRRRQLLSDDAHSDLRYDPNWRSNLKASGHFQESALPSVKDYDKVPQNVSSQLCANRQEVVIKRGYNYIADTHPGVVVTSPVAPKQCDQPYHLHPPDRQAGSVISPNSSNYSLQHRSQDAHFSSPSSPLSKNEEVQHAMHIQQFKTYNQQGLGGAQGGANKTHQTSARTSPKVLSQKKLEGISNDIVKSNKVTLGRDKPEPSSYMMVHAQKKMSHKVNKVQESLQQIASTESQEYSSDRELMWLQKTQQLRVTHISKEKKAQQKVNPNPPQKQHPPAVGVGTEQGNDLNPPLARPANFTQPKHPEMPPTIHLNINLNTLSHLLPSQQKGQGAVINLASLQSFPHWISTSEVELTLSPPYLPKNQAQFSQISQKGVDPQLKNQNWESTPETRQRATASKWPLSCEGVDKKRCPNEVHCQEIPHHLLRTPTTTLLPGSGPHTVLPPIGKPLSGREVETIPGQNVNTADPIHRSSSDSYLVQMERQKKKARGTHKAFTLTDYKQLKSDITLGGLGPDYKDIEKTKMKQQRLYSNVIHEQNKKIGRIPFLPDKDPQGNKKTVPRMKALEYAKTIANRPVQSQPKQRQKHQSESSTEYASHLEGLDVFQPAALNVLKKRHEEEKQVVALFGKVHAV